MNLSEVLAVRDAILEVAAENGADEVWLFGSVVKAGTTEASDVDVLVTLRPNYGLMAMARIRAALESLLGCPVDVSTPSMLRESIRDEILRTAIRL